MLSGTFCDECPSLEWFRSHGQAGMVIEAWRRHYNDVRPHNSIGYLPPEEFAAMAASECAALTQATGRSAAVWDVSSRRSAASWPTGGSQTQQMRQPSQGERGRKKSGR
jgi:hypothetical protein